MDVRRYRLGPSLTGTTPARVSDAAERPRRCEPSRLSVPLRLVAPASRLSLPSRRLSGSRRVPSASSETMTQFLDEGDFDAMREAMVLYDEQRDTVIKRSRDVTKAAKVAIYCLHRGELDKADAQIAVAVQAADELLPLVEKEPQLRYGSYAGGLEEYAEAAIFAHFVRTGTILPSAALLGCDRDEYLGGVLDFTGELNRYCVARATVRDVDAVTKCRDVVDALMGIFPQVRFSQRGAAEEVRRAKYMLRRRWKTPSTRIGLTSAAAGGLERTGTQGDAPPGETGRRGRRRRMSEARSGGERCG